MNRNALKSYAPKARRDFIAAVTARAAKLGVTAKGVDPISLEGDFAIIGGTPFPKKVAAQRKLLERRIQVRGFSQVMESAAYTWFNRLAAIRYMEIHGYLDHGYRVLSHPSGDSTPEIIQHADSAVLPGLNPKKVLELKLDGRKDEELYQLLLVAQCNALHSAMPFLFERIDDETELLLPENLLHSDSIVRQLVSEIEEADWAQIEIIGWLYQYYIAQRHDEVIGEIVEPQDIPAATQVFTPNWIVKYLVQNCLGAKWLATYPNSPLRSKMQYYVEPAPQPEEVLRKIAVGTPAALEPEELTVVDPACGSGHIIVEAYDLLKEIYLERGYSIRQIPRLILEKNIFAIDIDDRAVQLAGFSIAMKARADDREIFKSEVAPTLNVLSIQESEGLNPSELAEALTMERKFELVPNGDLLPDTVAQMPLASKQRQSDSGLKTAIESLVELFRRGKTIGSLATVSADEKRAVVALRQLIDAEVRGNIFEQADRAYAISVLSPLVKQAELLSNRYDAVIMNPPYMGGKYFCASLKSFVAKRYKGSKGDLYGCFISRGMLLAKPDASVGMITIPNWMFLSTYADLRSEILSKTSVASLMHNGRGVWGADFGSCSFILRNEPSPYYRGSFRRLFDRQGEVQTNEEIREKFFSSTTHELDGASFQRLPGNPFAYWISDQMRAAFLTGVPLGTIAPARQGLATADNDRFVRAWYEVNYRNIGFNVSSHLVAKESGAKWFPYNKGGDFRKWYGNQLFVVNWDNDGYEVRNFVDAAGKVRSRPQNTEFYFRDSLSWSDITSSSTAFRSYPVGFIYDVTGMSAFAPDVELKSQVLGFCNSKVASALTRALNPTVHFQIGNYQSLPFIADAALEACVNTVTEAVSIAKSDWDSFETSWDFSLNPLLSGALKKTSVEKSFAAWAEHCAAQRSRMKELEECNNQIFINVYGLSEEIEISVDESAITLASASEQHDAKRLISYAIGCIMGRYSLAEPGLLIADSEAGVDKTRYGSFLPDDDGITPLADQDWFPDDVANRIPEFLKHAWPNGSLPEDLKFIADAIGHKAGETSLDSIRRYLSRDFFKDHLQNYKNRPIYWLFSSGKEKAFECLVYLHRYNPGTLSRMRMEYVVPLQGRMRGKGEQIQAAIESAPNTGTKTRFRKELEVLKRKQAELVKFDEELRHFADQRIELDFDDGVKINYSKFGGLLSEVKKVAGDSDE